MLVRVLTALCVAAVAAALTNHRCDEECQRAKETPEEAEQVAAVEDKTVQAETVAAEDDKEPVEAEEDATAQNDGLPALQDAKTEAAALRERVKTVLTSRQELVEASAQKATKAKSKADALKKLKRTASDMEIAARKKQKKFSAVQATSHEEAVVALGKLDAEEALLKMADNGLFELRKEAAQARKDRHTAVFKEPSLEAVAKEGKKPKTDKKATKDDDEEWRKAGEKMWTLASEIKKLEAVEAQHKAARSEAKKASEKLLAAEDKALREVEKATKEEEAAKQQKLEFAKQMKHQEEKASRFTLELQASKESLNAAEEAVSRIKTVAAKAIAARDRMSQATEATETSVATEATETSEATEVTKVTKPDVEDDVATDEELRMELQTALGGAEQAEKEAAAIATDQELRMVLQAALDGAEEAEKEAAAKEKALNSLLRKKGSSKVDKKH